MFSRKVLNVFQALFTVVFVVIIWEICARIHFLGDRSFLPPFTEVLVQLYKLGQQDILFYHFSSSLIRVLAGLLIGVLSGFIIGFLMGYREAMYRSLGPLLSLLYPIPALGWLPLLMIWIGINEALPIIIIAISTFFPMYYSTVSGIRSVDRRMIQAAKILGASNIRILKTVVMPLALPAIFSGLRLSSGMSWRVVIAAEMVAIPTGIGALLMQAESLIRVDIIIGCLFILALMCFCFENMIGLVEKSLTKSWKEDGQNHPLQYQ
ncbi:MAG: ABC transporter permease [Syntrophaceae bacterium]|nr:ABC transporter permease [Syntrophaceae bacterium]